MGNVYLYVKPISEGQTILTTHGTKKHDTDLGIKEEGTGSDFVIRYKQREGSVFDLVSSHHKKIVIWHHFSTNYSFIILAIPYLRLTGSHIFVFSNSAWDMKTG